MPSGVAACSQVGASACSPELRVELGGLGQEVLPDGGASLGGKTRAPWATTLAPCTLSPSSTNIQIKWHFLSKTNSSTNILQWHTKAILIYKITNSFFNIFSTDRYRQTHTGDTKVKKIKLKKKKKKNTAPNMYTLKAGQTCTISYHSGKRKKKKRKKKVLLLGFRQTWQA